MVAARGGERTRRRTEQRARPRDPRRRRRARTAGGRLTQRLVNIECRVSVHGDQHRRRISEVEIELTVGHSSRTRESLEWRATHLAASRLEEPWRRMPRFGDAPQSACHPRDLDFARRCARSTPSTTKQRDAGSAPYRDALRHVEDGAHRVSDGCVSVTASGVGETAPEAAASRKDRFKTLPAPDRGRASMNATDRGTL